MRNPTTVEETVGMRVHYTNTEMKPARRFFLTQKSQALLWWKVLNIFVFSILPVIMCGFDILHIKSYS